MCNKYGGEMRMAFDKMDWHAVTFPDSIPYENAEPISECTLHGW